MVLTLELRTSKVLQNFLPIGWVIKSAQVWFQLATENLQSSRFANAIGPDKSKHLPWSRHRKAMELEAVGRITMRDLRLEVCGKIDDIDGSKGAFLDACGKGPSQQWLPKISFRLQDASLG